MFAIVKTGGKQYIVREGETLRVERINEKEGSKFDLQVLMVADEKNSELRLGAPNVNGAKVSASVIGHGRAEKVPVVKYKPKVRYKRNVGHRQPFTTIKVESIK